MREKRTPLRRESSILCVIAVLAFAVFLLVPAQVNAASGSGSENADQGTVMQPLASQDNGIPVSVKFMKKKGKLIDVRKQAGKKLLTYTVIQGACSDGKNVYIAFEQRNGDSNGNGKARIKIAKVRIRDWKVVNVSPKPMKLGHANDITYNARKKVLVVTGAKTHDPYVRMVSPKTLKKTRTIRITLPEKYEEVDAFNGIVYDKKTRTYTLRSRGFGGLTFTLDDNFKMKKAYYAKLAHSGRFMQGGTLWNKKIVIAQSLNQTAHANTFTVYSRTGKQLQDYRLRLSGELESVFVIKGKLYGVVHTKSGVKTNAYIFRLLM